jgi:hypothetical protein
LIVGQQEEMALGMLAAGVVSLQAASPGEIGARANRAAGSAETAETATRFEGNGARDRFVVLDGTRADAPESGWWRRFAEQTGLSIELVSQAGIAARLDELAAEVTRRMESGGDAEPPVFLVIYNLARFRELRRSDDDFGFSSLDQDKPASAARLLVTLLRDGPGAGIHCLIWSDTLNTVNRWFDRATLREFDQRVLMQMSANDSSNLMDSPAASRLGQFRALLYSEEMGQYEKFRPYGIPSPAWLDWLTGQFAHRAASTPSILD